MTAPLLARLREFDAKATHESWLQTLVSVVHGRSEQPIAVCCMPAGRGQADAALIAEMRNALPALLAVVEAAEHLRDCEDCGMGCGTDLGPIFAAVDALRKDGDK